MWAVGVVPTGEQARTTAMPAIDPFSRMAVATSVMSRLCSTMLIISGASASPVRLTLQDELNS